MKISSLLQLVHLLCAFASAQQQQEEATPVNKTEEELDNELLDDNNNEEQQVPNHDFRQEQNIANPCVFHDIYLIQDESLVATAKPIATRQSIEDFYNYNPATKSYDGSEALKQYWGGKRTIAAIHQSKLTCELSLVLLNSRPWQGPINSGLKLWVTGDLWNPVVQDDPSFISFMLLDDKYDSIYLRKRNMTGFEWTWGIQDTDGMAHPIVNSSWTGCIQVLAEFGVPDTYFHWDTPNEFKYVSGGVGDDTSLIDLQIEDQETNLFICVGVLPMNLTYTSLRRFARASEPFPEVCDEEIRYDICGYCTRPVCHWHWFCNVSVNVFAVVLHCELVYVWFQCCVVTHNLFGAVGRARRFTNGSIVISAMMWTLTTFQFHLDFEMCSRRAYVYTTIITNMKISRLMSTFFFH